MTKLSRVLIAGGGVGGLALAQGLAAAGVEVAVFERDVTPRSRLQGYRLSLTPAGLAALKALLPPARWHEIVAACTAPLPGIAFVSERLEPRFYKPTPVPAPGGETQRYSSISRATLRGILMRGIEDRVHFGRTCLEYARGDDGRVTCFFAEGSTPETGDVLVGAEGTRSMLRRQLLGATNRYDTGVSAIAGKVPGAGEAARALTAPPLGEAAVVLGDAPQGLFIATHQLAAGPADDNYVFWSFLSRRERFPAGTGQAPPVRLAQVVEAMTHGWHPRLKSLIHGAMPDSVQWLDYASSRRPPPWAAAPVTLLGDAIHNMPPTGGEGANVALKDAATLRDALFSVIADSRPLDDALADYQARMLDYAFAAVASSMHNLDRMVRRDGPE